MQYTYSTELSNPLLSLPGLVPGIIQLFVDATPTQQRCLNTMISLNYILIIPFISISFAMLDKPKVQTIWCIKNTYRSIYNNNLMC